MERIDVDRIVSAKFAFEEAMLAALYDNHTRLTETSVCLLTTDSLRAVSEAVGVLPTAGQVDGVREVFYGGCRFWCHDEDVEVTHGL